MTTTLSERVSQSAFDGSMLRVVLLMDLHEGTQQQFFEAYEQLRHDIASVPGHISDQLCQSFENPPNGSSPVSGRVPRSTSHGSTASTTPNR